MGYAIEYANGETVKSAVKKKVFSRKKKIICIVCGAVVVAFALLHINAVRRFLLPGNPEITERAIVKMVDELKAGEGLYSAVTTFCQEVIRGGLAD